MEWLKAILEKAKIEDGKLDIDGVMSTVNSEFTAMATRYIRWVKSYL